MTNPTRTQLITGQQNEAEVVEVEGDVVAAHQTNIVTDPDSPEAVQKPIDQQTGTVGSAGDPTPTDDLDL